MGEARRAISHPRGPIASCLKSCREVRSRCRLRRTKDKGQEMHPSPLSASRPRYRHALPQLEGGLFLTDAGLETTLIFHDGIDLPCFAAFDLMKTAAGRRRLTDYYAEFARLAVERG